MVAKKKSTNGSCLNQNMPRPHDGEMPLVIVVDRDYNDRLYTKIVGRGMAAHIVHDWQVDTGINTVLAESNSHTAPSPDADPVEVARSSTCNYLLTKFPTCKSSGDATTMAQRETKASRGNLTKGAPSYHRHGANNACY